MNAPHRALVGVVVVALVVSACSLGDKQARADRIATAVRTTVDGGIVTGTVSATLVFRAVDVPAGFTASDLAVEFDPSTFVSPTASARFIIDGDTARLVPGDTAFPVVLFDDIGIRLRRIDAAEDDARPWLSIDYDDLTEGSGELEQVGSGSPFGILAVLDPRVLLDLAAGPLAGSVEVLTQDSFAANFDIPRALEDERDEDYDDERLDHALLVLDLLRVHGDVHPGEVVLRDDTVARFEHALHLRIDRYEQFDLVIELEIDRSPGARSPIAEPGPDEIILVDSIVPIRNAAERAAPAVPDPLAGALGG